jgi:hypothetical protein
MERGGGLWKKELQLHQRKRRGLFDYIGVDLRLKSYTEGRKVKTKVTDRETSFEIDGLDKY